MSCGRLSPAGRRVFCQAIRLGGRLYTTRVALRAFVNAMNDRETEPEPDAGEEDGDDAASVEPSDVQMRQELERDGIAAR